MDVAMPVLSSTDAGNSLKQFSLDRNQPRLDTKPDRVARIAKAVKKLRRITNIQQAVEVVVAECLALVEAEAGAICLLDGQNDETLILAGVGEGAPSLQKMAQKLAKRMVADPSSPYGPLLVQSSDTAPDPEKHEMWPGKVGAVACVPITTASGLVGALSAANLTTHRGLDHNALQTLVSAIDSLSLAVEAQYQREQMQRLHEQLGAAQEQAERLSTTVARLAELDAPPAATPDPGEEDVVAEQAFETLIGKHQKMEEIYNLIEAVAPTDMTVCITGESGTGKTLIAREIHNHSSRRDGPFVEVACGVLSDSLLESELFGHVRGSFTGAVEDQAGKFELANGGTIFLDEIATASPAMQVKLLRVLQERKIERVGGRESIPVDVRVIVAANVDLAEEVEKGTFRNDLFYRVNVLPIHVPSLHERVEDVPMLANHFMQRCAHQHGLSVTGITPGAILTLQSHQWPGNVRELENAVQRAMVLARGQHISEETLAFLGPMASTVPDVAEEDPDVGCVALKDALAGPEKDIIVRTLEANDWNRNQTADVLEINRTTLYNKMRKYGLLVA